MEESNAVEQTCIFSSDKWLINSFDGPKRSFYQCEIVNPQMINESETITINTLSNKKSNSDVEAIWYNGGVVKYFCASIFTIFPKVEHFLIEQWNGFENMKKEYLKNATSLKVFRVHDNKMKSLEKNLFMHAPNLEVVNLRDNEIIDINRLAFNGLHKLQRVYLQNNRIQNLHADTFKLIKNLQILHLSGNYNCHSQTYNNYQNNTKSVQIQIITSCDYKILEEVEVKEKTVDSEKLKKEIQKLEEKQAKCILALKTVAEML